MPGFTEIHPYQNEETVQGILKCLYELQETLKEVSGMAGVSLQPMAGAHGEFTGILVIEAYHRTRNNKERDEILVPDTAHGTNPASAAMVGYKIIEIPSKDGCVDLGALKAAVGERTAGLMLTNPNTLGIFEKDICEVAKIVHDAGGLVYYDGANLNAIMGCCRPGDMGFDVLHFNLHKTFATPHGGGGPGSGPVGVREDLVPFLPVPVVGVEDGVYYLDYDLEHTIGKVSGHFGNIGVCMKAWAYVKLLGGKGLRDVGEMSVLNSNYMKELLKGTYGFPHRDLRKHEFVLSAKCPNCEGIKALNIAKRLLDYGVHPPTIYFPHIVEEAMMFEPTETEPKRELDRVVEAMLAIAKEDKQIVLSAPHSVKVSKVDETLAAKDPILSYKGLKARK